MKRRDAVWVITLALVSQFSAAQKKWDGEAKDTQWNNPINWYPNGIPGITDDVILDHTFVPDTFSVVIMDTTTAAINSLQIISKTTLSIRLLIPASNLCSPALHLNSPVSALAIGQNAILQNRSGATAGNSITLNGSMIIMNDGKYLHATLRGNTALVSKLIATDIYRMGIFEFDVPGTAGYILSLSGRQFPILHLSSSLAGKKSYSASGNGNCTIKGHLTISDSSSLNLSINGNLMISGDLKVNGKFQWQPTTSDTTGRELQFNGDSCRIQNTGLLKMGANFRKLVVNTGRLTLGNSIRLDFPIQGIEVRNKSALDLDSFYCSGPGWFMADSLSSLHIGSSEGISDTTMGNIRMGSLNIKQGTMIHFNADKNQITGMRFPSIVSALTLNKPSGELILSRDLIVTDSIALNKGILLSNRNALLEFTGERIIGRSESFIKGPLKRTGKYIGEISFPVGDDSSFAPTSIHLTSNNVVSRSYTVSYHARPAPNADSLKNYPLKSISKNEYWNLESSFSIGSSDSNIILRFPIGNKSLEGFKGQPNIVYFDTVQMKWIMMPLILTSSMTSHISTNLTAWKNGIYTLGEPDPMALPDEKINLSWKRSNKENHLQWQVVGSPMITSLQLEISNCNNFNERTMGIPLPSHFRSFKIASETKHDVLVKIKASLENGQVLISNIIRIPSLGSEQLAYPNPSSSILNINTSQEVVWVLLQDGRKILAKVIKTAGSAYIDTSHFPAGTHRVQEDPSRIGGWQSFVKH